MSRTFFYMILGLSTLVIPATANAADCSPVLRNLDRTIELDVDSRLHLVDINTLSQSSSASSATDGSFSLPLPVGDLITTVEGNFSRKKNKMAAVQKSRTLTIDKSDILRYRLVEGDPEKTSLAKLCLNQTATELVSDLQRVPNLPDHFRLDLRWVPPGGASKKEIYLTGPIIFENAEPISNSCDPKISRREWIGGIINQWNWWFREPLGSCEILFKRSRKSQPILVQVPNEHRNLIVSHPAEVEYRWERKSVRWDEATRNFIIDDSGSVIFERSRRREGEYNPRVPEPNAGLPRRLEPFGPLVMQDQMREQGWVFDDIDAPPENPIPLHGTRGSCQIDTFSVEPYQIRWSGTGTPHRGDKALTCPIEAKIYVVRLVRVDN